MAVESAIFWQKSPHKFSDTDPSNLIISKFTHFEQLFSLRNSKTTYSVPFKPFSTIFHISSKLGCNSDNTTIGQYEQIFTQNRSLRYQLKLLWIIRSPDKEYKSRRSLGVRINKHSTNLVISKKKFFQHFSVSGEIQVSITK